MLLDRRLLSLGNLMFVSGIGLIMGWRRMVGFFRTKLRGSLCFVLGFGLVLCKYTLMGMAVEMFGFINLFGDFFPSLIGFLRRLPLIGTVLNMAPIAKVWLAI